MKQITQRFARLVLAALESPATVDTNALLDSASHFLAVAQADGLSLARAMATAAMDFAVWPESYPELKRAAQAFQHGHEGLRGITYLPTT
jgi:hypothetical protein